MNDKKIVINQEIKEKYKSRISLTLLFSFVVFLVLLISVIIAALTVYLLARENVISVKIDSLPGINQGLMLMALISLIVGTAISAFASKIPLRPINRLITQMNRLASGDFKARLHFGKPIGAHPAFIETAESFNKLADELEKTEMLRSDFINNFSHEFKTPIVSISGFAKLLKHGNLTEEQQAEYINVIEEESMRLSYMATNVLNLTKVENQTILTDISEFNLSEQIRSAVLLLENAWSRKKLELELEFEEITINANEELLKQMWINLIDNAIKFSSEYDPVKISIEESNDTVTVHISNIGEISEENQKRIWDKFYQADESHSSKGNGIGLAIVKRIAILHNGNVTVTSKNDVVTFTVSLPKYQQYLKIK